MFKNGLTKEVGYGKALERYLQKKATRALIGEARGLRDNQWKSAPLPILNDIPKNEEPEEESPSINSAPPT